MASAAVSIHCITQVLTYCRHDGIVSLLDILNASSEPFVVILHLWRPILDVLMVSIVPVREKQVSGYCPVQGGDLFPRQAHLSSRGTLFFELAFPFPFPLLAAASSRMRFFIFSRAGCATAFLSSCGSSSNAVASSVRLGFGVELDKLAAF
jgi:hypothetical protein